MSDRLAISAAFSMLMMAAFALSGPQPSEGSPFSGAHGATTIEAGLPMLPSLPSLSDLLG